MQLDAWSIACRADPMEEVLEMNKEHTPCMLAASSSSSPVSLHTKRKKKGGGSQLQRHCLKIIDHKLSPLSG